MKSQSFKLKNPLKDISSQLGHPEERRLWKEIQAHPQYTTNFLRLGNRLTRNGQYPEAVIVYSAAVRNHPSSYLLLIKLGLAYEHAGEEAAAIRTYRRIIRRFPDRFQAYRRLEVLFRRSLHPEKAISLYRDIPPANPIKERSYQRLYQIYARRGDFTQAIEILQEAFKNYGESYERCLELGKLYFRQGDFLGAVQFFESAVAFHPASISTRCWLGISLKKLGNLRLAEYEFNEILRIRPDSYQGLIHLAELKVQAHHFQEAGQLLDQLDGITPLNARVIICRGWMALLQGDMKKAISCCEDGLKRTLFYFVWEQVLAHQIMMKASLELGRKGDSEFHKLMATAIAGKDTYESLIGLGERLIKQHNYSMATRVLERILELFPHNTRALICQGEVLYKEEKLNKAVSICRQALERIKPIFIRERIRAHVVIAQAYKSQKKTKLYKNEQKIIYTLLSQLYLKPKEKSEIKKGIAFER